MSFVKSPSSQSAAPIGFLRRRYALTISGSIILGILAVILSLLFPLVGYYNGVAMYDMVTWSTLKAVSNQVWRFALELRRWLRAIDFLFFPFIAYVSYWWRRQQNKAAIGQLEFRSLVKFELIEPIPCGSDGQCRIDITALFQRTVSEAMYNNDRLLMLIKDGCALTTREDPFVRSENEKYSWLITNALMNHFLEVLNAPSVMLRAFSKKTQVECFVFALTNLQPRAEVGISLKMRCYLVKESALRALKFGHIKFGDECSERTTFKTALSIMKKMSDLYEPPLGVDMKRKDRISPHVYKMPAGFGRFWLSSPASE